MREAGVGRVSGSLGQWLQLPFQVELDSEGSVLANPANLVRDCLLSALEDLFQ